jgi:hypothetical protein
VSAERLFELARHLTERDREVALYLYRHRVLTTDQLQLLFFSWRRRRRTVSIEDGTTRVHSGDSSHVVRHTATGDRCTCPWFTAHGAGRGPCKHILAARLARR